MSVNFSRHIVWASCLWALEFTIVKVFCTACTGRIHLQVVWHQFCGCASWDILQLHPLDGIASVDPVSGFSREKAIVEIWLPLLFRTQCPYKLWIERRPYLVSPVECYLLNVPARLVEGVGCQHPNVPGSSTWSICCFQLSRAIVVCQVGRKLRSKVWLPFEVLLIDHSWWPIGIVWFWRSLLWAKSSLKIQNRFHTVRTQNYVTAFKITTAQMSRVLWSNSRKYFCAVWHFFVHYFSVG